MKKPTNWRRISLWRIALCISRSTLEWWSDPRTKRLFLRSPRSGAVYHAQHTRSDGWEISPRAAETEGMA